MSGRLERIWIKRRHGGPMDERPTATLVPDAGLVDNADQGGRRQVTLLSLETWQAAVESLGVTLDPVARRANFLVSGIQLENSRGRRLRVGDCILEIHGETRPCNLMEETQSGLLTALDPHWGGGAYASVVTGGEVRVDNTILWLN